MVTYDFDRQATYVWSFASCFLRNTEKWFRALSKWIADTILFMKQFLERPWSSDSSHTHLLYFAMFKCRRNNLPVFTRTDRYLNVFFHFCSKFRLYELFHFSNSNIGSGYHPVWHVIIHLPIHYVYLLHLLDRSDSKFKHFSPSAENSHLKKKHLQSQKSERW